MERTWRPRQTASERMLLDAIFATPQKEIVIEPVQQPSVQEAALQYLLDHDVDDEPDEFSRNVTFPLKEPTEFDDDLEWDRFVFNSHVPKSQLLDDAECKPVYRRRLIRPLVEKKPKKAKDPQERAARRAEKKAKKKKFQARRHRRA